VNFLTPFFMIGGLAIAAPVIFHLVRKITRDKTAFSSLMFLLPSPPRLSQRHRLEHWLLLLLRCAALALLAIGFARPFLRQAPVDDPTAVLPRRIAILVDTSASLRREGLWDAARARVSDVLRRTGPTDQVAIYRFDQQASPLITFEEWNRAAPGDRVALALGRVATLSPSWSGTHLGKALVTAAEALAEEEGKTAPGPRQIVLVSDLQAGSRLDTLQAYEWPKGVDLLLETVTAKNSTNAGVQIVADGPDSTRAADAPVRVRVTNAGESKREQFKLGWTRTAVNATTAPADFVGVPLDAYVPPGQSRVFSLPLPKGEPDVVQISLRGDDEAFDNTATFIPPVQQRATVLWFGADTAEDVRQPLFFLRRAFSETPRLAVQVVTKAPAAALLPSDLAAAQMFFVAGAIPTETAAALRAEAEAGKVIVVTLQKGDPAAGATLGALLGREPLTVGEIRPASYAMLAEIDFQHPLFAPFSDPRFSDFTKIHFWQYRKIDPAALPGARVVARFDSGDPAVVEVPVGRGRITVLASGWQPDDSQLAVSSKFVPLVWSLLEIGGGLGSFVTQYSVGDPVSLPAGGASVVRGPDGVEVALPAGAAVFTATVQPGLYAFTGGARPVRFAVNLDANESRTAPLGSDELEQLGVRVSRGAAVGILPVDNKTLLQGIETENRQKLWRWFIAATLAVLLVESLLAGWTTRRAAAATNEVSP